MAFLYFDILMNDKKIIDLEEKIAYLQNLLDDLNMTVFRQGKAIEKINNFVKDMKDDFDETKNNDVGEKLTKQDKPPHY